MTIPGVENTSTSLENRAKALRNIRFRHALFNGLQSIDPAERGKVLSNLTQTVKNWAKDFSPLQPLESTAGAAGGRDGNESGVSPPPNNYNSSKRSSISDGNISFNSPLFTDGSGSASVSSYASPIMDIINDGGDSREETDEERKVRSQEHLNSIILAMLRMSIDCPFADVRNSLNKCLNKLRMMEIPVPAPISLSPSSYITPEEILTLEWPSEYANNSPSIPRPVTPGRSPRSPHSPASSLSSSNSSSFSEEIPRIIQQPLTPLTPIYSNPSDLPVGKQPDELTKELMVNTFIKIGRLSHYYRVLSYFPSFMERYQESYNTIVRAPVGGPLPMSWRFYIGMMAASQHKCQYIVSKLTDDFLMNGGHIDWLQGLQHTPQKIRNLAKLNTILAHQPWRLRAADIGELVRGSANPQNNWTTSEIAHVIVILSTFHGLSSFALGCGIVPEYDSIGGNYYEESSIEEPIGSIGIMNPQGDISPVMASGLGVSLDPEQSGKPDAERAIVEPAKPIDIPNKPSTQKQTVDVESLTHTNQLIKRLKDKSELLEDDQDNYGTPQDFENVEEETFTDEQLQSDGLPLFPLQENFSSTDSAVMEHPQLTSEEFSKFLDPDLEIPYEDFVVKSDDVFKLQDFSWETQGVGMVDVYLPNCGDLLNQEFDEVREMTDYRLFNSYKSTTDINTKPLRRAIWFYVLRLYGLQKDDYEYRDINTFLNKRIKAFLKKVCCKPEEITYDDWRNVGFQLREEEKCHVNLIAVEARKQAELIHGLSCVMKWENERRG